MRRSLLLIAPLFFILLGCAKPEAAFVGKWQFTADAAKTGNAQQDALTAQMSKSFSISFKADKTASIDLFGQSVPCTYVASGKTATVKVSPAPGASATPAAPDKPIVLTLSDDGKTLTSPDKNNGVQMKFAKSQG